MEENDDLNTMWGREKARETPPVGLGPGTLDDILMVRIRKERKVFVEYFWSSFIYQNIMYGIMIIMAVKFIGDTRAMVLSLAGILLYLPFTIVLLRKYRVAFLRAGGGSVEDIYTSLQHQYLQMSQFYRFKRGFDWVGVPLGCLIIVLATFQVFVHGGIEEHVLSGVVLYLVWVALFVLAIRSENKKRFVVPLRALERILTDLKSSL